jgi:hypothetical protein
MIAQRLAGQISERTKTGEWPGRRHLLLAFAGRRDAELVIAGIYNVY